MTKTNRVLAAEDSPTQAAALRAYLLDAGFDVELASNGAEALALMDRQEFDLIVSDVVMPDVDGYELCRQAKERDPNLPVVLLTSLADPMDVVHALSAGADNFLRKPYQPTELIHRIRSMLYTKELRADGRTQMGLELYFLGRRFMINSDREQILDLLVSTFEDLVAVNTQLRSREDELAAANVEIEARLRDTETERERLHAVLAAVPHGMVVVDQQGTIVEANEQMAALVGVSTTDLRGRSYLEPVSFVDHAGNPIPLEERCITRSLTSGVTGALGTAFDLFVRRGDQRLPVIARSAPVLNPDGAVVGAVATLEDIRLLMAHDPVTGLPGHGVLVDRLGEAIDAVGDDVDAAVGLIVLVVDRYERIREGLPPAACERLVATLVDRVRATLDSETVRKRATTAALAHLGNADLAVVLTGLDSESELIRVAELLVDDVSGPVQANGIDVAVTVTISARVASGAVDATELASAVAAAARRASAEGGRRVTTSDLDLHARVVHRLQRENELRRAIASDELVVHYQPEVHVRDGQPAAFEALVRWQHPERGLLGADEVIPLAIESGLIVPLGWWVLAAASREAVRWRRDLPGGERLDLSVNLAAEQLRDPDVAARIAAILAESGLDPSALVLEVTESSMSDLDVTSVRLEEIKALGVRIAVDDFGTGYSSLLQLRRLPIDILKIDRSFIAGMIDEPADAAIVAGTVRLARTLGLEVVAEGVETVDQLVQLRILGCDLAQGYHWARPLPAADVAEWWSQQARDTTRSTPSAPTVLDDDRDDATIAHLIHELRAPLASIVGFAEVLESAPEGAPTQQLAAAVARNAWDLESRLRLVTEARDAREGGGLRLTLAECDLAELVSTAVEDIGPQLAPHDVVVHADGPITVMADRNRLTQAFTNLLTNAAKFSSADAPIDVSVVADDGRAAISVRDRGPGVPEHRRQELFRRFSRLGSRTKGMGIGLYLSRLIVDAHGGTMRYDDAPGGGAVFSIELDALR